MPATYDSVECCTVTEELKTLQDFVCQYAMLGALLSVRVLVNSACRRMEATAVDLHCNDGHFKPQERKREGRRVRIARPAFALWAL